ncbi:hypothetical protein QOT17_007392 [Balamuthia mandrillaris]
MVGATTRRRWRLGCLALLFWLVSVVTCSPLPSAFVGARQVVDCATLHSCDTCTNQFHCGWCNTSSACLKGSAASPADQAQCPDLSQWFYQTDQCAPPPPPPPAKNCSTFLNCSTCLASNNDKGEVQCGWCETAAQCQPVSTDGKENSCLDFRTTSCKDPCVEFSSCETCSSDDRCGWCNAVTCAAGNASTPYAVTCGEWQFATEDCATPKCLDFLTCHSCLQDSNSKCGWCDDKKACLDLPADIPTKNPLCPFNWFTAACPAPVMCHVYKTCVSCTDYPECEWCGDTSTCNPATLSTSDLCFSDQSRCFPGPHDGDGTDGAHESDEKASNAGMIAFIAIASTLFVGVAVGIGLLLYRRYWHRRWYFETLK